MSLPPVEIPLGAMRFNSDSQKLEYWNGYAWIQIHTFSPNLDGGGRGVWGGGNAPSQDNVIQYITISTQGNATDFGDLLYSPGKPFALGSQTRGIFSGGYTPSAETDINYITFSSTGNAIAFGDNTSGGWSASTVANNTRGIMAGRASPAQTNIIDYITIAQIGNALDFGDLTIKKSHTTGGMTNGTRGVVSYSGNIDPTGNQANIDYITIPTLGNAHDFGDCVTPRHTVSCVSNSTRGVAGGGLDPAVTALVDYITIATTGNSTEFGDLTDARRAASACASSIRGLWGGGGNPSLVDIIDFVTIATQGNAADFGNLNAAARESSSACSNSHGGLG